MLRYEDYRRAALDLAQLIQLNVLDVNCDSGGTLKLRFDGGAQLDIYDDSPHYESYVIRNHEVTIVV